MMAAGRLRLDWRRLIECACSLRGDSCDGSWPCADFRWCIFSVAVDGLPARFAAADDGSWPFALD
jgi:hypothetical protein